MRALLPRFSLPLSGAVIVLLTASVITAQAGIPYIAFLSGPAESPPNASPGTGTATVDVDAALHTMHVHVDFTGLVGTTTASHIHAPTASPGTGTAGVATTTPYFAGFPIGVTAGTYDIVLDMTLASSYNPSYVTANGGTTAGAEAALETAIAAGKAYLNIHSNVFPGGEIRGFLAPEAVPVHGSSWGRIKTLYRGAAPTAALPAPAAGIDGVTAAAAKHSCCE
ncbi:MAG: CHRD domain-containing protein [Candidatus Eisenbacteria bacterium]|nr:CHRD domain-containing protein [Candidatus Eisenbacteria bacterium]